MRRNSLACLLLLSSLSLVACGGDDPVDVTGEYTVAVANEANPCDFAIDNAEDIPVVVTQNGESTNADVGGLVGGYLDLAIGSSTFLGTTEGSHLELKLTGTVDQRPRGNCDYTIDAVLEGDLEGDYLEGQIIYTAVTDGASDCAELEACVSVQAFNGTRPPGS